ncbi:hypothetical protein AZA_85590 [Nitrospirillum viridazoti Y2]|nr:hypothetical protein AZA_85590 [Nitrospirillum amazonense Y2]
MAQRVGLVAGLAVGIGVVGPVLRGIGAVGAEAVVMLLPGRPQPVEIGVEGPEHGIAGRDHAVGHPHAGPAVADVVRIGLHRAGHEGIVGLQPRLGCVQQHARRVEQLDVVAILPPAHQRPAARHVPAVQRVAGVETDQLRRHEVRIPGHRVGAGEVGVEHRRAVLARRVVHGPVGQRDRGVDLL